MPGLGFAFYVLLLLGIFVAGVTGIAVATSSVFWAGDGANPYVLTYGGNVEPVLLAPMRGAGLFGPDEVPDAFHAEDLSGATACALRGDQFLRLGPEGASSFPLASLTRVEAVPEGVHVVGDGVGGSADILCRFATGEGGDRFLRMLAPRTTAP